MSKLRHHTGSRALAIKAGYIALVPWDEILEDGPQVLHKYTPRKAPWKPGDPIPLETIERNPEIFLHA